MTKNEDDKTDDMFSRPTGAQLRDDGMERAVEHADAVKPKWSDDAFEHLRRFAESLHTFTSEDVREVAERDGLAVPPDSRAWGGVVIRAVRAGIIVHNGDYRKARAPKVHCSIGSVWRSLVFRP